MVQVGWRVPKILLNIKENKIKPKIQKKKNQKTIESIWFITDPTLPTWNPGSVSVSLLKLSHQKGSWRVPTSFSWSVSMWKASARACALGLLALCRLLQAKDMILTSLPCQSLSTWHCFWIDTVFRVHGARFSLLMQQIMLLSKKDLIYETQAQLMIITTPTVPTQ